MKIQALLLTAALVIPLTLTAQGPNSTQPGQSPQISLEAQHFLVTIATEDQSEIDLAHLALKKSGNQQVRNYAKSKILAADPSMKQDAVRIGHQNGSPIVSFPNSTDKSEYYYLSKLSGKAFDKAYMSYEDAKQHADLIMVQGEANTAKNQQIKNYAQKEVTPVREAAQSAKQITQSLGG